MLQETHTKKDLCSKSKLKQSKATHVHTHIKHTYYVQILGRWTRLLCFSRSSCRRVDRIQHFDRFLRSDARLCSHAMTTKRSLIYLTNTHIAHRKFASLNALPCASSIGLSPAASFITLKPFLSRFSTTDGASGSVAISLSSILNHSSCY